MTLDEIMVICQSDKASKFSRTYAQPHDYCRHLERFFEPLRYREIKLIETGVGGGESIRAWLEYFEQGHIYGVDIVSNTNEWNTAWAKPHKRYTFSCGDQSNPEFWNKFVEVNGGDFDVVIDDGSHNAKGIMTTFESLWLHLKSGGIYEVEDLNYDKAAAYWMRGLAAGVIEGDGRGVDSIYFSKELCVMRKK